MALDTYDNLVKEIVDWSHRGDLGTKIPDFILLAENAMYSNSAEVLKVRSMEVVSTALTDGQYLELPANFESSRSVRLTNDNTGEIKYQSPQQMSKRQGTGLPYFFTIVGNEIQFDITPDNDYTVELQYFRKATPLSTTNQTNEILTNHPSIYLYGALAALFRYTQDTEEALFNEQRFIESIKGANKADKKGRYGPALYSSPSGAIV
jgi:hypothetical protein